MVQDKNQHYNGSVQNKAEPQPTIGTVTIAGEQIDINSQAIPSQPGTQSQVIRGLKEASEKGIFRQPDSDEE